MVYIWKIRRQEVIKMDLLATSSEKSAWVNLSLMTRLFSDLHCKNNELWTCCVYCDSKLMWGGGVDDKFVIIVVKMVHSQCLCSATSTNPYQWSASVPNIYTSKNSSNRVLFSSSTSQQCATGNQNSGYLIDLLQVCDIWLFHWSNLSWFHSRFSSE